MKAILIERTGGVNCLRYTDVPAPEPKPNEVLIRVQSAAINYIDTLIRAGMLSPDIMPKLPFIPGVECSGVIEKVGSEVRDKHPGQYVVHFGLLGTGAYAEYIVADADRVRVVPDGVSPDAAAAIPVNYATAYHMLHVLSRPEPGQTVLIHAAAGGVGTALIQLSKAAGLRTIGVVGSDDKKAYAESLGADFVINRRTEKVRERIMEITEGKGVHLSFNPVSGDTVLQDAECLAPFGQIIIFGFLAGTPQGGLEDVVGRHFNKSIAVRVSDIYTLYLTDYEQLDAILGRLFDLQLKGVIDPKLHAVLPLADAGHAHWQLEQGLVKGKLILKP